jgi:hypothetical protein
MELARPRCWRGAALLLAEAVVEGAAHRLNRHASRPDPRGPFQAGGRPVRSARSLIPRSIRWLITKATAATGSTSNRAHHRV